MSRTASMGPTDWPPLRSAAGLVGKHCQGEHRRTPHEEGMAGDVFEQAVHGVAGEKRVADYSSPADTLDLCAFRPPATSARPGMPLSTPRMDARPRPQWRVGWLALAAGLLLGIAGVAPDAAAQTNRKPSPAQKEAELKKVNARIEKVRKSVNADLEKRDKLSVQLRDAELGVQASRRQLDDVRAQRIASEARLADLEREQAQRERELAAERGALAGELRTAYVNGREEQLKLLLNQQDPAAVGRMLAYYGYFGRARAERIAGIRDKLEHLMLLREKIAAETGRLRELESQQEQQVATLKGAQQTAQPGRGGHRHADQDPGRRDQAPRVAGARAREADRRPAQGAGPGAGGQAGAVRAVERQAAVARAAGQGAGAVRPAARRRLAALAGHADRHRARGTRPGPVRRAGLPTPTGCRAWG